MPINHPDFQIWTVTAGDEHSLARISGDASVGGGESGFDLVSMFVNDGQLVRPTDIVFDTVHDRFFVVDSDGGTDRILQGSISQAVAGIPQTLTILYSQAADEGTPGDPFDDGSLGITGVALDAENGLVYFTEANRVSRVGYDSAGQTPVTIADLGFDPFTGSMNFANEIAFNAATGQIFVVSTETFTDFFESPPGSGNFVLGTVAYRNAIFRIDNVAPGDVDDSGNTITKLEFDTHEQNSPVLGGPDTGAFPDELGRIMSVDVDTATGDIWFVAIQLNGGANGEVGGIYRIGANGGAHEVIYSETNATGQNFQFIEVDAASGRYFVTSIEPGTGQHNIYVGDLAPGAPTLFATVSSGGEVPLGLVLNNGPTLAALGAGATAVESAGPGSGQSAAVLVIADADAGDLDTAAMTDQLAGAQVRISAGFGSAPGSVELLTIGGATSGTLGSGIAFSYNAGTGVMVLTGAASFADYEAALESVAYSISGDDPDAGGTAPTRTLSYSVSDGLLSSDEQDVVVNVAGSNDGPVNTTGGAVAANEDSAGVAVTGLSVADADDANLTVTLSVTRGTINVAAGPAATSNNGTATVTLSGTAADINTTLGGVTYVPTPNLNGPDTLTMTSDDGSATDIDNVAISVTAVNDAPTVAGDGTEDAAPIVQDMPSPVGQSVASLFGGQYSDAADQVAGGSSADAFAGVAVTANGSGASGQWQYFDGVSWVNIGPASDGAAVLLSASTSVRFNPAPGFFGAAPTLTVHLVDASGGALTSGAVVNASVTGGTTRYSTGTVVLSETVIAGNTAPTGVTGTLSVREVSANGTLVGTLTATDPDSATFTYSLVNDAGGRFNINATTGAVTVENGLLLDHEQNASHVIRVRVDDNEGGVSEFNVNVAVTDWHGELVVGDNASHIYYGGSEFDILFGGHGSDEIHGGGGIDIITGGNIILDPSDAGDQLYGDGGNDIIDGNGGDDTIRGGADSDVLIGAEGNDTIYGGSSAADVTDMGSDIISGDAGNDFLYGNGGNDDLLGGNDNDQLFGGAGNDDLDGGSGVDRLDGGAGADDLTGGSGFDVFVFRKGQANGDEIFDFDGNGSGAGDTIRLEGYAAGTTFTRVGSSDTWKINDHGFIEYVTINSDGNVHSSDWGFF